MASRYLLIEFDDDKQAESLKKKIDKATKSGKGFRVIGYYARPSNWCKCFRRYKNQQEWKIARGPKLGWWICLECRKPMVRSHHLVNLLKMGDIIKPWYRKGATPQTDASMTAHLLRDYTYIVPELYLMLLPAAKLTGYEGDDKIEP